MKVDWDQLKAAENVRKHGVTFQDAASVFDDPFSLTLADHDHSEGEERFVTLGFCQRFEILLVVHTYRNIPPDEYIRIISARKATQNESALYLRRREGPLP